MRTWSFYDPSTGLFAGRTFSADREDVMLMNVPQGLAPIEGHHDHLSLRVDVERLRSDESAAREKHRAALESARAAFIPGQDALGRVSVLAEPVFEFCPGPQHIVEWRPAQPDADHEWNATTRRWVLTAAAQDRSQQVLQARDRIAALESRQPRADREVLLALLPNNHPLRCRLQAIEDEIASLRPMLSPKR